jgi:uncharacterized protein YdaU (DUF1376 family)
MNHYPRHIGDYLRDTSHLSLLEHGVYSRLLDLYYLNDGPIPGDMQSLCRKIGARTIDERSAVEAIVAEFFRVSEAGMLVNKRCDVVIAKYKEHSELQRQRVNKRYQKPTADLPTVDKNLPTVAQSVPPEYQQPYTDTGIPTINHKPITINQEPVLTPLTPRKRGNAAKAAGIDWFSELPPELDTEDFRRAWTNWVSYRHSIKRPLNPASAPAAFRKALEVGVEAAIRGFDTAMANGWQGAFPVATPATPQKHDHRSEKRSREFPEQFEVPDIFDRRNRRARETGGGGESSGTGA